MKQKIFIFAVFTHRESYINDAEECGDTIGYAIIKDEEGFKQVTGHYSSGINWTKHDMGITSDWKHDIYGQEFPNGYELIWLGGFENCEEAEKEMDKFS